MKPILFVLISITIVSVSCKKEGSKNDIVTNPILGTWDFVSIEAQTQSAKEAKVGPLKQRMEATLNYVTTNNIGGLIIADSIITKTGLAYVISSQIQTRNYINGKLADSSQKPYNASFNDPSSSCDYKITGDSISFPKGGFIRFSVSTIKADPLTARVSFNGDTLTLKEYVYKDSTETRMGLNYHNIQTGTATITFLRHKN